MSSLELDNLCNKFHEWIKERSSDPILEEDLREEPENRKRKRVAVILENFGAENKLTAEEIEAFLLHLMRRNPGRVFKMLMEDSDF